MKEEQSGAAAEYPMEDMKKERKAKKAKKAKKDEQAAEKATKEKKTKKKEKEKLRAILLKAIESSNEASNNNEEGEEITVSWRVVGVDVTVAPVVAIDA